MYRFELIKNLKQFKLIINQTKNIQKLFIVSFNNNNKVIMHLKPSPEDNGVISKAFLKKLCRSDFKQYYSTPQLNDVLYLHYKGFQKIDNLEEFTGLKVIYLEGNAIKKIENLEKLVNLRCLYLQENLIREIQGLDTLTNLVNLNLSDNMIQKITGLENLSHLSTLQIKRNKIGVDGISDVIGLLQCQSISALDLSDNRIETEQIIPQVLQKMSNLSVVYLQNNGFNKKVSHYRKTLITKIPTLKYIDDKPVFDDQKRFAQAWARGGLQQQRKQRVLYKKQEQQKQIRQHQQFRAMIEKYKQQNRKKKYESEQSSDSQSDSQEESLETYNTPVDSKEGSQRISEVESGRTSQAQSESASQGESESESHHDDDGENDDKQVIVTKAEQSAAIQQKAKVVKQVNLETQQRDSSRYLDELD